MNKDSVEDRMREADLSGGLAQGEVRLCDIYRVVHDTNERVASLQREVAQLQEAVYTLEAVASQVNELHHREFGAGGHSG
ncbi:MAG: hypothetical protein K0R30_120 [Ornithinibacter sp.]|jgi:hypothetical protein|nr:hypothetical protein [Ornithinibacter sp.]